MAVRITGKQVSGLTMQMTHDLSGVSIETDPPLDNGGEGKSFSPTDLVASGLGACMMSVMGIAARKKGISLTGMECSVGKHMSTDLPRRIVRLEVIIQMPIAMTPEQRMELEVIANTCPVIQSLHPSINIDKQYVYR